MEDICFLDKLLCYIKEQIPDYVHSRYDFNIFYVDNKIFIKDWKLKIKCPEVKEIDCIHEDCCVPRAKKRSGDCYENFEQELQKLSDRVRSLEEK